MKLLTHKPLESTYSNQNFSHWLPMVHIYSIFKYFLSLLYWGYIVTLMKVLTIYHTWIHPLHHSLLFPTPLIPGIVSTDMFHKAKCSQSLHLQKSPVCFNIAQKYKSKVSSSIGGKLSFEALWKSNKTSY
jgi:hypothetical protein